MKKKCITALALGLFLTVSSGTAKALIINLDAYDSSASNPVVVSLSLDAGTYNVTPVGIVDGGQYNAWNAWGYVSGCDATTGICSIGWINNYTLSSSELGTQTFSSGVRYQTDLLALQNAVASSFSLSTAQTVNFYIADNPYYDNLGGMSLDVTAVNPVPEPTTALLFGAGLVGLASCRRRK